MRLGKKHGDSKEAVEKDDVIDRYEAGRVDNADSDPACPPEGVSDVGSPSADRDSDSAAAEEDAGARIAEIEDRMLRLRAEFANYKRRAEKERGELTAFVKAGVYREIFPVLDDFERFFRHVEERRDSVDNDFVRGIEMIHRSLVGVLQRQGIETIQETGVPFDPNFHEAMLMEKVDESGLDHAVVEVLEAGYRLGDLVIRPARVKVGIYEAE